jgi:hypothetical protein
VWVARSQYWAFNGLLIYYWVIFAFVNTNPVLRGSLLYYALLAPILLYTLLSLRYVSAVRYTRPAVVLGVYLVVIAIIAVARRDFDAISTTLVLVVPLMIVLNSRVRASPKLLIGLFWLSVLWSVVSYYLGLNLYGFLPGQTLLNLHQGLWWRISLFPYHPSISSGLFALLILYGILCLHWTTRFRWVSVAVAAYFMVLSGSRTALLAAFLVFGFSFLARHLRHGWRRLLPVAFLGVLLMSMIVVNAPSLLVRLAPESDLLASFFYRSTSLPSVDILSKQFARPGMWRQYQEILLGHMLVGVGSFDMRHYFPGSTNWSESRVGYLLARDGLVCILFFYALFMILRKGIIDPSLGGLFYGVVVSISFLYYSSYLNTYNFMYLAVIGLLNWQTGLAVSLIDTQWLKKKSEGV